MSSTPAAAMLSSPRKEAAAQNDLHQSAAIFGHFQAPAGGPERTPAISASIVSRMADVDDPAARRRDERRRGMRPDYLKQRKGRTVEFLLDTLKCNPALWRAWRTRS